MVGATFIGRIILPSPGRRVDADRPGATVLLQKKDSKIIEASSPGRPFLIAGCSTWPRNPRLLCNHHYYKNDFL